MTPMLAVPVVQIGTDIVSPKRATHESTCRFTPSISTIEPPRVPPNGGKALSVAICVGRYVNAFRATNEFLPHRTATSTTAASCGGVVTTIEVAVCDSTLLAGAPPNVGTQGPWKSLPKIVIASPPASPPRVSERRVINNPLGSDTVIAIAVGGAV